MRWTNTLRCVVGGLVACVQSSCQADESGPQPSCDVPDALWLTLGTGHEAFTPIVANTEPPLQFGSQGGTHLDLAVQVDSVPRRAWPWRIHLLGERLGDGCPEGCVVGEVTYHVDQDLALAHTPDAVTFAGLRLIVAAWPFDEARRLTARVTDDCERFDMTVIPLQPSFLETQ